MIWTQFKLLLPSYAGYWVFLMAVLSITHYLISRSYTKFTFKWIVPVTISTATVAIMIGNSALNIVQGVAVYNYQQSQKTAQAATGEAPKSGSDEALQLKSDFLKAVEQLASNPDQVNDEVKNKLFNHFGKLFANPSDKEEYFKNISSVYECQRYFWEDALASFQAKKEVKSNSRVQCEKAPGTFFGREKLLAPESVKGNSEAIAKLAAHQRLPAAEGKTVDVNEAMLRSTLERQIASLNTVKRLFQ